MKSFSSISIAEESKLTDEVDGSWFSASESITLWKREEDCDLMGIRTTCPRWAVKWVESEPFILSLSFPLLLILLLLLLLRPFTFIPRRKSPRPPSLLSLWSTGFSLYLIWTKHSRLYCFWPGLFSSIPGNGKINSKLRALVLVAIGQKLGIIRCLRLQGLKVHYPTFSFFSLYLLFPIIKKIRHS